MTAAVEPGAAPRWGRQASFIQPQEPAFWLYCALLGIGGYLFVQEQSLMSSLVTAYLLSWALVLVYAVPVAFVIYRLDLFEREPKMMLAAAVVWGGVVATSLAANANEAWLSILSKVASPDFAAQWGAAIVGPGVEETLKLMGVVILYLVVSSEFDGVMDGFVYGAMVGLGFTVVEDVSYFINAVAAVPGAVDQSGPVLDTFLIRVVGGGLYGHVLFTGLTGTGFAFFVTHRADAMTKRLLGAGVCIAAGVSAHVVWNSPWMESILQTSSGASPSVFQWVEYGAVKGLPFLILLSVLVMFATRSEEANYRLIVAGEPDPMVATDDEIRSLRSLWARRSARTSANRLRGSAASKLTGRLQAAQIEYAMIRSGTDSLTDPSLDAQRLKIRSIRAELAAVPFLPRPMPQAEPAAPVAQFVPPAVAFAQAVAPALDPAPDALAARLAAESIAGSKADTGGSRFAQAEAAPPAQVAAPAPVAAPPIQSVWVWTPTDVAPSPAPAFTAAVWTPTHVVPAGGMAAWDVPDPARPPVARLSEHVELVIVAQGGAWAQVRGLNGWTGWVDGRLLVPRRW
ncbi:MAG TPA: PrsW family glutamic-type intramembrane protease [Candidatus Limnocylindrales bacterium]|jgi:RsiW-degrading membrane proteinase PrsW (M82 family)